MNREKLIKIFKSEQFRRKVPSPFIYMFLDKYPPIENGYWERDGECVYTGYDLSSDHSSAYSLIIEIGYNEDVYISFDNDDGAARWKDEELEQEGWSWRKF